MKTSQNMKVIIKQSSVEINQSVVKIYQHFQGRIIVKLREFQGSSYLNDSVATYHHY